jgi:threonine synthase
VSGTAGIAAEDRVTGARPARAAPTWIACSGCGRRLPDGAPVALRCPEARDGDDIDHVLVRHLDPVELAFPGGDEPATFVRHRTLLHAYHAQRALGRPDAEVVAWIERLDAAVEEVDGRGFRETPFARSDALSDLLGFSTAGGVWVKDETGNVSGSHKARHLMGTMLEIEAAEAVREAPAGAAATGPAARPPLAIASCGNAALAAAVVARAAGRELLVFIPEEADPFVVARLRDLEARIEVCPRQPGVPGDPTYHRLLAAVADGALPFTCQGNLNGLAIEGGETLGWEIASSLVASGRRLDRLFVQVGGGALASSAIGAFLDARLLGVDVALPRLHSVQAANVAPLARAHGRVLDALRAAGAVAGGQGADAAATGADATAPTADPAPLDLADPAVAEVLDAAARHRSAFMWPWEAEPRSVAGGILDDETYDWLAVVRGTLASGGTPLVVGETTLVAANDLARSATGIDVDHTGSSGLAGLLAAVADGRVGPDESVGVLFTGVRRGPAAQSIESRTGDRP